jgi:hypothetical protein
VALPLCHIELHHANDDCLTQCIFILAPLGGTVKALSCERFRSASMSSKLALGVGRSGTLIHAVVTGAGTQSGIGFNG